VYWEWLGGIPFGDWAEFYGVTAADVIEFPANNIDPATVGDYANANIKTGSWLIIPNGKREFVNWSAPLGVTRENPASARVLGQGRGTCGGAVGYGNMYTQPTSISVRLRLFRKNKSSRHRSCGSEGGGVYARRRCDRVFGWNN
jgi:hypothetical protein